MEPSVTHVGFYLQVHDRLLLSVIYSGDTGQVTFTLIRLDTVYDIDREILGGHGAVIAEILLSVHKYPGDGTSVDRYSSVLIHLNTRKPLDELLQHRSLGNTERTYVEHQGIINHLGRRKRIFNYSLGKKDTALVHLEDAQLTVTVLLQHLEIKINRTVSHE